MGWKWMDGGCLCCVVAMLLALASVCRCALTVADFASPLDQWMDGWMHSTGPGGGWK